MPSYWLCRQKRWTPDDVLGLAISEGDLMYHMNGYSSHKNYYVFQSDTVGWEAINKTTFETKGGTLPPEETPITPIEPLIAPFKLGSVLTAKFLLSYPGGEWGYRPIGWIFTDARGNVWKLNAKVGSTPNNDSLFSLIQLADGSKAPSLIDTKKWKDGEILQSPETLVEDGFSLLKDPESGYNNYISRKRHMFFRYREDGTAEYVEIPPSKWGYDESEYPSFNSVLLWFHTKKSYLKCVGCDRYFNWQALGSDLACRIHARCRECMAKGDHEHCKGCERLINNSQPATPILPHSDYFPSTSLGLEAAVASAISGIRSCKTCGLCFRCTKECLYGEPDRDGRFNCRDCCKDDHYEDPDGEPQHIGSIRDYQDQHYPAPRPPMVTNGKAICSECNGNGKIGSGLTSMYCPTCQGHGRVEGVNNIHKSLWMGVELEVEVTKGSLRTAAEQAVDKWYNDIIIKRDSTIRHGFEVVTGPFSLAEHTKLWPGLSTDLVKSGCRSWKHTNTGLHIHCNWQYLSLEQLCMYYVFINEPAIKKEVIKIAGRESIFAALKPKKITDGGQPQLLPHREALNLTTHRGKTFELRIFKGTLALEHILADLQFVHSSVNWIKEAKIEQLSRWDVYWGYVLKRPELYKELIEHFNRQQEIERTKEDVV